MTRNRTIAAQIVLIIALSLATFALAATRAHASSGAPNLRDATTAPTKLSLVRPGRTVTYAHGVEGWNCPHRTWFTDVQAYKWNGAGAGRQVIHDDYISWRVPTGHVEFDGITFFNLSHRSVLVAGWCAR